MANLKELKKYQQFAEQIKHQDDSYLGYLRGVSLLIAEQTGEDLEEARRADEHGMGLYQSVEYADGRNLGYEGKPLPDYTPYALNTNAVKSDTPRDARLSGRVASADLNDWTAQADLEGISRTDLIIRVMNDYCASKRPSTQPAESTS